MSNEKSKIRQIAFKIDDARREKLMLILKAHGYGYTKSLFFRDAIDHFYDLLTKTE